MNTDGPLRGWPLAGLFAMPLVAGLATFVVYPSFIPGISIGGRLFVAAVAGLLGALITILGAGPVFSRWRQSHRLTLSSAILWGALFGNVPTLIMAIFLVGRSVAGYPPKSLLAVALPLSLGTLVGVACATVFWLVAARSTETRTPKEINVKQ